MVSIGCYDGFIGSTVQRFSPTPFARDSLVLRTLHDLPRNKKALSSLKYHIFTKILFTDLLQSLSSSWLKWLVLYHFKPGFHIIAPVATIAAVVEKRVSATVAIYGNTLFSDRSDKYDSGDERR